MSDPDTTMKPDARVGDALTWEPVSPGRLRGFARGIVSVTISDPDERRRGQIIAFLSIPLFLIGFGFLLADTTGWLAGQQAHAGFNILTDLLFCCAIAAIWLVNRRGHVTAAAIMHLAAVSVCLIPFFYYTPAVRIEILFVEPVFVAAFVLSPWATFVMAAVSSASFAALNAVGGGEPSLDLQIALGLFGLAIIAYLVASCLAWAVAALRETAYNLEQDIVARRQAEEARSQVEAALHASEQRNRTLIEESPAGVFLFDAGFAITECNARFAQQAGVAKSGLIGSDCRRAFDQQTIPAMQRALAGEVATYEGPYKSTADQEMWISLTASPLLGADGRVVGGIGVTADLSDRKQAEELVERLAYRDAVTGLPNRSLFRDRLVQAVSRAERHGHRVIVGVLDIDRFKDVNDSLGHEWGDMMLVGIGERIDGVMRDSDTVARSGSDEFLILFSEIEDAAEAASAADRVLASLRLPWKLGPSKFYASASIGLAVYPDDGVEPQVLIEHAHSAMRRVKERGGNAQQFYDRELGTMAAARLSLESELHAAIDARQLVVHYQPQIDVREGVVLGVEALVRWQHPTRGLLAPLEFITLAEETGLIVPLGDQVLRTACEQALEWQTVYGRPLRVAVNVSARQLREPGLVDNITRVLSETHLEPRLLEIELTETSTLGDPGTCDEVLRHLREMGISVSLDDFGTGYSSLSQLRRLPIDRLKIDRQFVAGLPTDRGSAAVVCAVIDLGKALGLAVVAEGVETAEQLAFLRARDCHEVQGFLLSRPLPGEACRKLLSGDPIEWADPASFRDAMGGRDETAGSLSFDQVRQAGLPAYWYGTDRELRYDAGNLIWSHSLGSSTEGAPTGRWQRVRAEDAPGDGWVHDKGCCCTACRSSRSGS